MTEIPFDSRKLSQARSELMAPHPLGEEESFTSAFQSCRFAFDDFDVARVKDKNICAGIETIKNFIETTDPHSLTLEEKSKFSTTVDELASWFEMEFWSV